MNRLNELKVEYDNLVMEKEQSEQLYTAMLAKTKEMDLNTKDMMQNLEVVDLAYEPFNPIKPRKALTLLLGLVGVWAWALPRLFCQLPGRFGQEFGRHRKLPQAQLPGIHSEHQKSVVGGARFASPPASSIQCSGRFPHRACSGFSCAQVRQI